MIKLDNVSKIFGNKKILDNLSFNFPSKGLFTILGASGSGKTTILNLIGLIDYKFDGNIIFKEHVYNSIKNSEKSLLRANHFGYIFQSFNLLESDTVVNNVCLLLSSNQNLSKENKINKINAVLKVLGIEKLKNKTVNKLSGGEKQRVAIARAIVNDPEVILCDEPTGSLDSKNGDNIFKILRELSKTCLVICVTHDRILANKYSDEILYLKDGKIEKHETLSNQNKDINKIVMFKSKEKIKNLSLSLKFIFAHIKNTFKAKKIRFFISSFIISISLIFLGLSILISSSVKSSLVDAFSTILGENSYILKKTDENSGSFDYRGVDSGLIEKLFKDYNEDIKYYGCTYLVDFEQFFKDQNALYNSTKFPSEPINGFNARHFNEFELIDDYKTFECLPLLERKLSNDEIVLGLNFSQVKKICLSLQIPRSYESLASFIKKERFLVNLYLKNSYWTYDDEQSFMVKGIFPANKSAVYHTNNLFNERLFEDSMRFPISLEIKKEDELPWIMKKLYYVKTKYFQSTFLNKILYDKKYENFLFDSDNEFYSPQTCPSYNIYTNKLFVYENKNNGIKREVIKVLKDVDERLKTFYFSTNGGYINYGNSIFCGSVKPLFICKNKEIAINFIDKYTRVKQEDINDVVIPKGIVEGNAFKPNSMNLKFSSKNPELDCGEYAKKVNEIVISSGLAKLLDIEEVLNQEVFAILNYQDDYLNQYIEKNFKMTSLFITGIAHDENIKIYQGSDFSISLYRDLFKEPSFNLIPQAIIYETEEEFNEQDLKIINSYFDDYELSNPLSMINKSVDEVMFYLEIVLLTFSIFTIITSFILLALISYVNYEEGKKDIAILNLIGFSSFDILKIVFLTNFANCLSAYLPSVVSLVILNFGINLVIKGIVGSNIASSFPIFCLFLLFVVILILSFVSILFVIKPIKSTNIQKLLH